MSLIARVWTSQGVEGPARRNPVRERTAGKTSEAGASSIPLGSSTTTWCRPMAIAGKGVDDRAARSHRVPGPQECRLSDCDLAGPFLELALRFPEPLKLLKPFVLLPRSMCRGLRCGQRLVRTVGSRYGLG